MGFFNIFLHISKKKKDIHTLFALKCIKHECLKTDFWNFGNSPPEGGRGAKTCFLKGFTHFSISEKKRDIDTVLALKCN